MFLFFSFFFSRLLIWDQLIDMIDDIFSLASPSRTRLYIGLVCCCCWYYYDYYCSKRIFLRLSRKEEEKKTKMHFFCLPSSFLNMYIIKKQRNKHRYTTNYDKLGLTLSYARRKKNVPIRNRWFSLFHLDFRQCTNRALAKLYVKDEAIELAKVNRNRFNDWLMIHSFFVLTFAGTSTSVSHVSSVTQRRSWITWYWSINSNIILLLLLLLFFSSLFSKKKINKETKNELSNNNDVVNNHLSDK